MDSAKCDSTVKGEIMNAACGWVSRKGGGINCSCLPNDAIIPDLPTLPGFLFDIKNMAICDKPRGSVINDPSGFAAGRTVLIVLFALACFGTFLVIVVYIKKRCWQNKVSWNVPRWNSIVLRSNFHFRAQSTMRSTSVDSRTAVDSRSNPI